MKGLEFLCSLENLQTHADLIAGLPGYGLDMLCADIRSLVGIGVDELQIESLKVLPGTRMRATADDKDLKFSPLPPYEILQTPMMSPSDLRRAMQISRMIDLYYNSGIWQETVRNLIYCDKDFIIRFTEHLKTLMVLNSPVSLERRGVILYEYCRIHYPEKLADVSVAWIEAGFSLKKDPAGKILRIKHLGAFLEEESLLMSVVYGQPEPSHRYYMLTSDDRKILFGYDSESHQPSPVFMASLRQK